MNSTADTLREQSRAIREQSEKKPEPRKETAREGRWRVEREKAAEQAKREPHKGY
ncbi:hypothetical protein ACFSHT_22330 [Paraburkholderia silviterrae]|uniref:hypothetical protein n=1 Tax=Paraburkholderia silviterrae TaxID=2528715 RepID=UPI00140534F7|nr:hypothetical protein [Paraburkholderia silviterrae]